MAEKADKKTQRTVSPPTGTMASTFPLRICKEHGYPVALTTNRPEFVCMAGRHRVEIEGTGQIDTTLRTMNEWINSK